MKATNGLILTELEQSVKSFMIDRKAMNVTKGTLYFYNAKLELFSAYCKENQVEKVLEITPLLLRQFILYLREKEHNDGGVYCFYRAVKTFLLWYEDEFEPEKWKNPIKKVSPPKVSKEPIEGISKENISLLIEQCEHGTFFGERNKAVLLTLVETGVRASELISINVNDIDFVESSIFVRQGKGRKPRSVFFGKTARKQLRTYLKLRTINEGALFCTNEYERLTYSGLREIVRRLSKKANIPEPGLHDFRRTFAIESLRNGVDIQSIARIMGHSSLQVISLYLKQTKGDLGNSYKSIMDK